MATKHKLGSLAVVALAVLFDEFFMFAKHSPALSRIIPFANDPYDAIGSIAMIVCTLLALLCLFRAFQPGQPHPPLALRLVFLTRAQLAVVMGVQIVLGADIVAMLRHLSQWVGRPAAVELLLLMGGVAAASLAVLAFLRRIVPTFAVAGGEHEAKRAAAVLVGCLVALMLYPEQLIRSVPLHFLTILVGDVLFFASVSALTSAVLPYEASGSGPQAHARRFLSSSWMQWSIVAMLGLAIGACALAGEMFGDRGHGGIGSIPPSRIVVVFAVFLGSGMSGLLLAYAFLGKQLGLFQKVSN